MRGARVLGAGLRAGPGCAGRDLWAGRGEEPGVGIGARPLGWAEGRDGLRGAGSAGGVERKARAESCALPGTPRRPGVGGGARGRGALCREEPKGDPDSGQSALLELTGGAGERGGGAAGRPGGLGLRWDRWEPGWT